MCSRVAYSAVSAVRMGSERRARAAEYAGICRNTPEYGSAGGIVWEAPVPHTSDSSGP